MLESSDSRYINTVSMQMGTSSAKSHLMYYFLSIFLLKEHQKTWKVLSEATIIKTLCIFEEHAFNNHSLALRQKTVCMFWQNRCLADVPGYLEEAPILAATGRPETASWPT